MYYKQTFDDGNMYEKNTYDINTYDKKLNKMFC